MDKSKQRDQDQIKMQLREDSEGILGKVVQVYRHSLEINPNDASAYKNLGDLLVEQGNLEEAVRVYRHSLEINPNDADIYYNFGRVLIGLGRLEEAIQVYHQALGINPDDADVYYYLGKALTKQGKLEEAIQSYAKVLEINPDLTAVYNNLGPALQKQGRLEEAVQVYHRALEISPDDARTHNNLGDALKLQGRYELAIQAYYQATEINPNYMKAYNNLGDIFRQQDRLEEAAQAYYRALEIGPSDANIYNNLGNVLQEQGKLELAIQAYYRATEINPKYLQAYNNLGNTFRQQDRSEEAIQAYQQAIGIDADYAEAHGNLGNLLRELGRLEPAIHAYRKSLSINPNNVAMHYMLAKTKKHGSYDHEICAMEALLKNPSIANPQKVDLYFALGKAFEDLQMYEKAFEFFSIGNRAIRETIEYDISQDEDFFKRLMNTFSKPLLDWYSGSGFDDNTPIFILGMPRSGTSLVEQILSSHNDVYGAGELYDLRQTILTANHKVTQRRFPDYLGQLDRNKLTQFGINYVKRLREYSHHARHITDKIPANFLYIGMIKLILPNARVIHCQRNPIDTSLSCFKNHFALGHRFSYDLQELGAYYRLYKRLMSHWDDVLPNYIFHFQYEDLITDQEKQTRVLLEHCGLEWEESCLSFHQTERLVRTMSSPQVRRPIYGDSVGLWKKYENQLQPLISALTTTE